MFERFTDRARKILVLAQKHAREHQHNFIGTEHLLYGLVAEGGEGERGISAKVLSECDLTPEIVADMIAAIVPDGTTSVGGNPPFTPRSKKVLELGLREALQLGHSYIGTEHLLLGLIREGEGTGATILADAGVNFGQLRNRVIEAMGVEPPKKETFVMPEDWIATSNGDVYIPAGDGAYVKATFAVRPDGTLYRFKQEPIPTWVVTS